MFSSDDTEVGEATFVIFETMDEKEFRVLFKHCFLMGKNTAKAKQWLDKRYDDSPPGKSTIIDWYAEFKRGRTNNDDAERPSRLKSAIVPENITKVHKIVLGDHKLLGAQLNSHCLGMMVQPGLLTKGREAGEAEIGALNNCAYSQ